MSTVARAQRTVGLMLAGLIIGSLTACEESEPAKSDPANASTSESPGARTAAAAPDSRQLRKARVAWSRQLDVIGQPELAGPAALVLARTRGGSVELVSLDRGTGEVNFRMPFHPGGLPTGITMTPRVTQTDAGRHLAILRRAEPGSPGSSLVAVDVRSGAVVASTPSAIDDYDACSDGHDVCWSGYKGGTNKFGPLPGGGPTRWDIESGRLFENEGLDAAMLVGAPDLYVRGGGRTSVITRLKGSRRSVWSQSISLAVAPGASSGYGWAFEHDKKTDVYVGALGRPVPAKLMKRFERGKRVELDYASRYLTVGIDGRTGEQLWRRKGANPWCPLLRSADGVAARTLCVVGGSSVNVKGRDPWHKQLTVELEGVDPRSGEMTWKYRLAGVAAKKAYADEKAPLAPFGFVVPSDDGPVALDMRTGETQRVDDAAVLFCPAGPERVTAYGVDRPAGTLYGTCTPDARAARGVPSLFGVQGLDGDGQSRFVSMPGRVVAYRSS